MKIRIEAAAIAELHVARDYYLEQASLSIATRFLTQVDHAVALLTQYPELGTPVSKTLRRLSLKQFPYALIYQLSPELLTVLAVAHQHRRPGYWAKRR